MNNKAFILALYFVALFIIVKNYYKQGSGMPYPTYITAPSYLYGVLGITADFTGGLSTVLAAGLTLALFYRTHSGKAPLPLKTKSPHPTTHTQPLKRTPKVPGAAGSPIR